MVAVCLFGLEGLLGGEIDALEPLGVRRTETIDGRVFLEAPPEAIPDLNIRLRYAERVLILTGRFPAKTFEQLFEGTRSIAWEDWIGPKDRFPVKGHSVRSALFSLPDCQKIIKKAVVTRLSDRYGIRWFEETGVTYQLEFLLLKDEAFLMIDTSGETLHKRGYRPKAGAAPLRETLAAAMAALSRPREGVLLCDPMCGSGTIAVEAAMLLENRAPGLKRGFAAESFPQLDARIWSDARSRAESEIRPLNGPAVFASDIDQACVELARANAGSAGVGKAVTVFQSDARAFRSPVPGARGTVVTNPPYGERLGTLEEARALAKAFGEALRKEAPMWQLYILSSDEEFEKAFGRKADKIRKFYNGMIPCRLYQFFKNRPG